VATRREVPQRLLAGRNSANPLEMTADFALNPRQPLGVPGVQRAAGVNLPSNNPTDNVLGQLAQWGSKKIREAAAVKYNKQVVDGGIAFQQGKTLDEIDPGDNEWALEGYRQMDATTAVAALAAAQQQEIAQGLHELDPEAYRASMVGRFESLIAGKDEQTQALIREQYSAQMPTLIAAHTSQHLAYKEGKTYEALVNSVEVGSQDPNSINQLISFAQGTSGSGGLSAERRKSAVVDGIIRAFELDNPTAYSALKAAGALDDLSAADISRLRGSQQAWETRARDTFSTARLEQERIFNERVQSGELEPLEVASAYAQMLTEQGFTATQSEGRAVMGVADGVAASHAEATRLSVETAKLNGDFGAVAQLTLPYARGAANTPKRGQVFEHQTVVEYSMGPKRPNKPDEAVTSLIGKSVQDVLGPGARVVVTSGMEDEGNQHGSARHKTGGAADVAIYRPDGTLVKATDPDAQSIARAAAGNGALGIGFGSEYMGGDHFHIDLIPPETVGGGNVWSSGAKAIGEELQAIMRDLPDAPPSGIDVDPARWEMLVTKFNGDTELASVALVNGADKAMAWDKAGRQDDGPDGLDGTTRQFMAQFHRKINGTEYVTAAQRADTAQKVYENTRDALALDTYNIIAPMRADLDRRLINGSIDQATYDQGNRMIDAQYNQEKSKAEIDRRIGTVDAAISAREQELAQAAKEMQAAMDKAAAEAKTASDKAQVAADKAAAEQAATDKANRLDTFKVVKTVADNVLKEAVAGISSMPKPAGMSEEDFRTMQEQEIATAISVYAQEIRDAGNAAGLEQHEFGNSEIVQNSIDRTQEALKAADRSRKERATIAAAVSSGTVGDLAPELQEKAWSTAQAEIMRKAQSDVAAKRATPEEAQERIEQQTVEFYSRAGFVPESVRNAASAALVGQLVEDNGNTSQQAIDTITEYGRLKAMNSHAASQYLDPEAQVTADAALAISGGNAGLLPGAITTLWRKGLESGYKGLPDPDFLSRPEVQRGLDGALKTGWFNAAKSFIAGTSTPVDLNPSAQTMLRGMIEDSVLAQHRANPRVPPQHLIGKATEMAMSRVAVVNGDVIVNPFGGDIYKETFGSQDADQYRRDPASLGTAIDKFVQSPEFMERYTNGVSMVPEPSFWSQVGAGVSSLIRIDSQQGLWNQRVLDNAKPTDDPGRVLQGGLAGKPVYDAVVVGAGKIMLEFILDSSGTRQEIVIPLKDIGDFLKKSERLSNTAQ